MNVVLSLMADINELLKIFVFTQAVARIYRMLQYKRRIWCLEEKRN